MNSEMQRPPVFGDVFAGADRLNVAARLRLSGLLAVPGRAPAMLAGQLAELPLPTDAAARVAVVATIASALDSSALQAFSAWRLDDLVPALRGRRHDSVVGALSVQAGHVLLERVDPVAVVGLTVGEIARWPGFGRRRVAMAVSAAVAAGIDLLVADAEIIDADVGAETLAAADLTDDLITVLVSDARTDGRIRGILVELTGSAPPDVRLAAGRLLSIPASPVERCVTALDRLLDGVGDQRDRVVFEHGVLPLGPVVTRAELADVVGVGAERVRQLQIRARSRVDTAVADAPAVVRELAAHVGERLGAAAPLGAVDDVLASIGLPPLPDSRTRLLVSVAGPYRAVAGHPGWVALDPAELLAETRRMLGEDGGLRLLAHVAKELGALGVEAEHVDSWLAAQPVRVVDGLVVATDDASNDVAERVLHACGRPLTTDEMAEWLPDGWEAAEDLWSSRDRRFVITDADTVALVEWGDGSDGEAALDQPDGKPAVTLRIEVGRDDLSGADGVVPLAVAHAIGLARGSRRAFTSRYGPMTVSYESDVPTRSSIRPIALAVGAAVGDEVVVTLYHDDNEAHVSLTPGDMSTTCCGSTPRRQMA